ncbi:MAG TPA: hypothetical protein VJX28_10330, partial [Chthoniobacterales bacterium]|nr:hypothetical protein [Chthoniobacterales bacterium]
PLGLAAPDHTVPYGTILSRDAVPGTSCQATIGVVPTGRACRHFATASSQLSTVPSGDEIHLVLVGDPPGGPKIVFEMSKLQTAVKTPGCGLLPLFGRVAMARK